jgi:hypothetical protein
VTERAAKNGSTRWMLAAVLVIAVFALALRYGTGVLSKGTIFDEPFIVQPIHNLIVQGWSVETAIDYRETKGPAFVWAYALAGDVVGPSLNALRLVSLVFFVAGVVPLLLLCRACAATESPGAGRLAGEGMLVVAVLYALLPHNAVLGQLVMSEPSFVFGALWLMWVFVWGFGTSADDGHAVLGPVIFSALLAVLMHHRIHAAAFGAAAALTAFERDRWRSWPWWLAGLAAGLLRVPLWIRWGGPVAPEFQTMHDVGFSPDAVTYLAAAVVPLCAIFLWPALREPACRPRRRLVWAGGVVGIILVLVAMPSLSDMMPWGNREVHRFLGVIATTLKVSTGSALVQSLLLGALAVVGAASLGALAAVAFARPPRDRIGVVCRLAMWTLVAGPAMYAVTRAMVFDRYLLPWAVLLPIAWTAALSRRVLLVQALLLAAIFARHAWTLLF